MSGLSRPIHLRNAAVANPPLQAVFAGSLNMFLAAFPRFCWYVTYNSQYTYTDYIIELHIQPRPSFRLNRYNYLNETVTWGFSHR